MSARIEKWANYIVNDLILAPIGMKLSYKIGNDPILDMVRLLGQRGATTIIDGGAHTGSFAFQAATVFAGASIEAFEPATEVFAKLRREIAGSPRIRAHKLALGAEKATRVFHNNRDSKTSSLGRPSADSLKYFPELVAEAGQEEVQIVALGEFCQEQGIGQIDIIKLDLQGGEMDALKGAGELLSRARLVFVEVQFVPLYDGCALFSDLDILLRAKGFDLFQLYDLMRSPTDGRLLYGDAMFVQRSLLSESR